MGYIKELIPKDKRKEYVFPNQEKRIPTSWTIDKEKNIVLFPYGRNIDDPKEKKFILLKDEKIIFEAVLGQEVEENVVKWSMKGYKIKEGCLMADNDVIDEFREAMLTYGFIGYEGTNPFEIVTILEF